MILQSPLQSPFRFAVAFTVAQPFIYRLFSGQFLPKEMFEVVNDNNLDFFNFELNITFSVNTFYFATF